jgi:hypothetical protein
VSEQIHHWMFAELGDHLAKEWGRNASTPDVLIKDMSTQDRIVCLLACITNRLSDQRWYWEARRKVAWSWFRTVSIAYESTFKEWRACQEKRAKKKLSSFFRGCLRDYLWKLAKCEFEARVMAGVWQPTEKEATKEMVDWFNGQTPPRLLWGYTHFGGPAWKVKKTKSAPQYAAWREAWSKGKRCKLQVPP